MDFNNNKTEETKAEETKTEGFDASETVSEVKTYSQEDEKKLRRRFISGVLIGTMCTAFVCAAVTMALQYVSFGSRDQYGIMNDETALKIKRLEALIDSCYYKTDVDKEKERDGLYRGLLDSLGDPYSEYYSEQDLVNFHNDTEGSIME